MSDEPTTWWAPDGSSNNGDYDNYDNGNNEDPIEGIMVAIGMSIFTVIGVSMVLFTIANGQRKKKFMETAIKIPATDVVPIGKRTYTTTSTSDNGHTTHTTHYCVTVAYFAESRSDGTVICGQKEFETGHAIFNSNTGFELAMDPADPGVAIRSAPDSACFPIFLGVVFGAIGLAIPVFIATSGQMGGMMFLAINYTSAIILITLLQVLASTCGCNKIGGQTKGTFKKVPSTTVADQVAACKANAVAMMNAGMPGMMSPAQAQMMMNQQKAMMMMPGGAGGMMPAGAVAVNAAPMAASPAPTTAPVAAYNSASAAPPTGGDDMIL